MGGCHQPSPNLLGLLVLFIYKALKYVRASFPLLHNNENNKQLCLKMNVSIDMELSFNENIHIIIHIKYISCCTTLEQGSQS